MVSVYTKGRYGNSTWQQMVAWVYAQKHGLQYSAPKQTLAPHLWPSYHQHLVNTHWNDNLEIIEVNDGKHSYVELPFKEQWRNENIMIGTKSIETGYFQSWKYITPYIPQLKKAFNIQAKKNDSLVYINGPMIHVRRGDYLGISDKHPVVTEQYLLNAIEIVSKNNDYYTHRDTHFTFCSDDIEWCKEFVIKYFPDKTNLFFYKEGENEESDFMDMVFCSYLITSNSTFSVLAGILNTNAKKIICPHEDNYFGYQNKHLETKDIMPPFWTRIKY